MALANGCARKAHTDWKFPGNEISVKQVNEQLVYDLGDGFTGIKFESPKKGHMVEVSVSESACTTIRNVVNDQSTVSRMIAYNAFTKACYPLYGEVSRDHIDTTPEGEHLFRTERGGIAHTTVTGGLGPVNLQSGGRFEGALVYIWQEYRQ
ncbi:MAG: hypothetical protein ACXW18_08735 [Pyrinomonadaceae bacterium]